MLSCSFRLSKINCYWNSIMATINSLVLCHLKSLSLMQLLVRKPLSRSQGLLVCLLNEAEPEFVSVALCRVAVANGVENTPTTRRWDPVEVRAFRPRTVRLVSTELSPTQLLLLHQRVRGRPWKLFQAHDRSLRDRIPHLLRKSTRATRLPDKEPSQLI